MIEERKKIIDLAYKILEDIQCTPNTDTLPIAKMFARLELSLEALEGKGGDDEIMESFEQWLESPDGEKVNAYLSIPSTDPMFIEGIFRKVWKAAWNAAK